MKTLCERVAGANSEGDGPDLPEWNERIAGANSAGGDRIFRNGMKENGSFSNISYC